MRFYFVNETAKALRIWRKQCVAKSAAISKGHRSAAGFVPWRQSWATAHYAKCTEATAWDASQKAYTAVYLKY